MYWKWCDFCYKQCYKDIYWKGVASVFVYWKSFDLCFQDKFPFYAFLKQYSYLGAWPLFQSPLRPQKKMFIVIIRVFLTYALRWYVKEFKIESMWDWFSWERYCILYDRGLKSRHPIYSPLRGEFIAINPLGKNKKNPKCTNQMHPTF